MSSKPCKDHLGNEFASVSEMCRHYNIPISTFHNRITNHSANYNLEQALTLPPDNHRNAGVKCKDHLGNTFKSTREMCDHYGIDRQVFYGRKKLGWCLKDILTRPLDYKGGAPTVCDHLGNEFTDIGVMCKHYGVGRTTYNQRIKAGWSIKDALTKQVKNIKIERKTCTDHLGNVFSSQAAMCRHYGITKDLLRSRLDLGWSLASILENPDVINPCKKHTDHLGKEFESLTDMLEFWGINETTYRNRIKSGMSLKECLETSNRNMKESVDHLGNKFDSVDAMCLYWNVPKTIYYARISKGKTLCETLTTIKPNTKIDEHLLVIRRLENQFYKVSYDGNDDVWYDNEIMEYYRTNILNKDKEVLQNEC